MGFEVAVEVGVVDEENVPIAASVVSILTVPPPGKSIERGWPILAVVSVGYYKIIFVLKYNKYYLCMKKKNK